MLALYPGSSSSLVSTTSQGMSCRTANSSASASSRRGMLGESAITASIPSLPSTVRAAYATNALSTPPEKATTTFLCRDSRSARSFDFLPSSSGRSGFHSGLFIEDSEEGKADQYGSGGICAAAGVMVSGTIESCCILIRNTLSLILPVLLKFIGPEAPSNALTPESHRRIACLLSDPIVPEGTICQAASARAVLALSTQHIYSVLYCKPSLPGVEHRFAIAFGTILIDR